MSSSPTGTAGVCVLCSLLRRVSGWVTSTVEALGFLWQSQHAESLCPGRSCLALSSTH